ncbi:hypothetical protein GCM10028895_24930 [Pontibacter rugosus]
MVAEAANEYKFISPWLIPYFSKKRIDMIQTYNVLRPIPHCQVNPMPQNQIGALLKGFAVELV